MADENNGENKGSSSMVMILAIVVALLAGGGGAAFFTMQSGESDNTPVVRKALFHKLDPFVITLISERRSRYMQVELVVLTRDEAMLTILTDNDPLIRNELIGFMSGMTEQDALLPETPEHLRSESLKRIQALLVGQGGELLEDIMIVSFVIQ